MRVKQSKNTEQKLLFKVSNDINQTSVDALKSIPEKVTSNRRQEVLEKIHDAGENGLIRHELVELTAIPLQSVCPLVKSLLDQGLIKQDGTRRAPSGRFAAVLVITESGRNQLKEG